MTRSDPQGPVRPPLVLSLEQALSMPYATERFVQLGWRVIRIEPTPRPGGKTPGDPNRYIGRPVAGDDRHSYFVAPNAGKQAIAIDLKQPEGRELLQRLIRELGVDVFCTNTMPARHQPLGIDAPTLRRIREELIWCSISALGLDYPQVPGYDPMIQALCGYMDLTGDPDGPPMQCGPPLIDLKAGDEVFAQVLLALLERERTGQGKVIDVSMGRVAASWLPTFLPMLDMGSPPAELRRSGNRHRQFIPVDAYPARDGFIYIAIGSDAQWRRLVATELFRSLDRQELATNEGRRAAGEGLHAEIAAITRQHPRAAITAVLEEAGIPHAPITPIEEVMDLPFVQQNLLGTQAPDGRSIRLPPAAVDTPFLEQVEGRLPFAPAYGEHTDAICAEAGLTEEEIAAARERRVVA